VGVATREEVHKRGHWHETFHCWVVSREDEKNYIYLQIRSGSKKDYPNLLDITAAGHLLAHETKEDGIREVQEELGIDVSFDELIPLGVMEYCVIREGFIDKELANVFLYKSKQTFDQFKLQKEEVSGIVRAEFETFYELWLGKKQEIKVEGFEINEAGQRNAINKTVSKDRFVPHENSYYEAVLKMISVINL
jgi:isopentenyldiphosphate isomerase